MEATQKMANELSGWETHTEKWPYAFKRNETMLFKKAAVFPSPSPHTITQPPYSVVILKFLAIVFIELIIF